MRLSRTCSKGTECRKDAGLLQSSPAKAAPRRFCVTEFSLNAIDVAVDDAFDQLLATALIGIRVTFF